MRAEGDLQIWNIQCGRKKTNTMLVTLNSPKASYGGHALKDVSMEMVKTQLDIRCSSRMPVVRSRNKVPPV